MPILAVSAYFQSSQHRSSLVEKINEKGDSLNCIQVSASASWAGRIDYFILCKRLNDYILSAGRPSADRSRLNFGGNPVWHGASALRFSRRKMANIFRPILFFRWEQGQRGKGVSCKLCNYLYVRI